MDQRTRVLQLTGSLAIGGAEKLILNLTQFIDPKEYDVHVCFFGKIGTESYLDDFRALNRPFHHIPYKFFYDPRTLILIARYVLENKINLIHTHLIYADIIGSIIGFLLRIPVITTLHNEPNSYKRRRVDRRLLAKFTAKRTTSHLVTVSKYIQELFMEFWDIPEEKITCVYNGIDLDVFLNIPEMNEAVKSEPGYTVVNIASLSAQKAQNILLDAARLVISELPQTRFLIVGQGELKDFLIEKAHSLGITDNIIFTGIRRDIPDILAQSHLFVLSSLWEGLPLAAIEAMAAARAVVVTNVGGIRELVTADVHGLVVEPGDVEGLSNAILTLLKNEEMRANLGQSARELVLNSFSIQSAANQYQTLYRKVLVLSKNAEIGNIQ